MRPAHVDADGIFVSRPEADAAALEWVGEPRPQQRLSSSAGAEALCATYEALRAYGEEVRVGDCVYVHPAELSSPCDVGLVAHLFEADDGTKKAEVRWFWRGARLQLPRGIKLEHKRELFLSDAHAEVDATAIDRKVSVYHARKDEKVPLAIKEQRDTFFYRRTYDPEKKTFSGEAPHAGSCAPLPEAGPPAKRARKGKKASPAKAPRAVQLADDAGDGYRSVKSILEKIESYRLEIIGKMDEVKGLVQAVRQESCAQQGQLSARLDDAEAKLNALLAPTDAGGGAVVEDGLNGDADDDPSAAANRRPPSAVAPRDSGDDGHLAGHAHDGAAHSQHAATPQAAVLPA